MMEHRLYSAKCLPNRMLPDVALTYYLIRAELKLTASHPHTSNCIYGLTVCQCAPHDTDYGLCWVTEETETFLRLLNHLRSLNKLHVLQSMTHCIINVSLLNKKMMPSN